VPKALLAGKGKWCWFISIPLNLCRGQN